MSFKTNMLRPDRCLIVFICFYTLVVNCSSAQQAFDVSELFLTEVYEVPNTSKNNIYSKINKWVAVNYKSANNVIQMNDKDAGILVVKGVDNFIVFNPIKRIRMNNSLITEKVSIKFHHTIQIEVKDNKFRVKYSFDRFGNGYYFGNITDWIFINSLWDSLDFNNPIDLTKIEFYKKKVDELLKMYNVSKRKRQSVVTNLNSFVPHLLNVLRKKVEITGRSISMSIKENDKW